MSTPLVIVRGAGSALVLTQDEGGALPHVVHWGTDLPDAVLGDLAHLTGAPVDPSNRVCRLAPTATSCTARW